MVSSLSNSQDLRFGPWYLKILKTVNLCKNQSMKTRTLPLQNEQKVRCKYWFHLIKHTPFIRFIVFHQYYFFFVRVNQTHQLFSMSFCIFKLTVNKVFNSIEFYALLKVIYFCFYGFNFFHYDFEITLMQTLQYSK